MTDGGRDPFAHYRARLDAIGFRPSSARGQNFLLDPTLHRVIAEAAAPGRGDLALEIGIGLGFLTRELAARAGRVVGVEIDDRLLAVARDELRGTGAELLLADALGGPGGSIDPAVVAAVERAQPPDGAFLVVANLPYAVSGPLLAELTCLPRAPDRIVVLVQRELGLRLASAHDTADYGGLAAQLQASYAIEYLRTVGAEVFRPRPKVSSAIVRLVRRPDPPFATVAERRSFQVFVRVLFGKRRKVLRTTLAEAAAALQRPLPSLAADVLQQRAEALSPAALVALWRQVAGATPPASPLPGSPQVP